MSSIWQRTRTFRGWWQRVHNLLPVEVLFLDLVLLGRSELSEFIDPLGRELMDVKVGVSYCTSSRQWRNVLPLHAPLFEPATAPRFPTNQPDFSTPKSFTCRFHRIRVPQKRLVFIQQPPHERWEHWGGPLFRGFKYRIVRGSLRYLWAIRTLKDSKMRHSKTSPAHSRSFSYFSFYLSRIFTTVATDHCQDVEILQPNLRPP